MKILLDTNILIRLANEDDPQFEMVQAKLATLWALGGRFVVVPQTICEFWVAATKSQTSNGLGQSPKHVLHTIDVFLRRFELLHDTPVVFADFLDLVEAHEVRGTNA